MWICYAACILIIFLGLESDNSDEREVGILNGLKVSLTLSLGFVFVFAIIEFSQIPSSAKQVLKTGRVYNPWNWNNTRVSWSSDGRRLPPCSERPEDPHGDFKPSTTINILFGISYAFVSIGCSAPIFFLTVGGSFSRDGIINGSAVSFHMLSG